MRGLHCALGMDVPDLATLAAVVQDPRVCSYAHVIVLDGEATDNTDNTEQRHVALVLCQLECQDWTCQEPELTSSSCIAAAPFLWRVRHVRGCTAADPAQDQGLGGSHCSSDGKEFSARVVEILGFIVDTVHMSIKLSYSLCCICSVALSNRCLCSQSIPFGEAMFALHLSGGFRFGNSCSATASRCK